MSEGHVYVAASGFGLRVIPKSAPYRYALATTRGKRPFFTWTVEDREPHGPDDAA